MDQNTGSFDSEISGSVSPGVADTLHDMSNPGGTLMIETVTLPERLGFDASRDLYQLLMQHRGTAVHIDGSQVSAAGTLSAQVLLSALRTWQSDGQAFTVDASARLQQDFEILGISSEFANEGSN